MYRKGLDKEVVKKIRQALLAMNKDEEGRTLLQRMGIEGFILVDISFYKPIQEMIAFINKHEVAVK